MSENNEATTIAANALLKRRADMLFEIAECEKRLNALRAGLVHLDAVLRMMRPDFTAADAPIRLRRPSKSPYFSHGELTQRIYDALRERGEISSADVATRAMRDKGMDPENDRETRKDFTQRVTLQLGDLARKGKVERLGKARSLRWRLTN